MRRALYDREHGYYVRRDRDPFGTKGDFFTAVQLMPVFGEVLSSYARGRNEQGAPLTVLDLGAGRAGLSAAFLHLPYIPVDWQFSSFPDTASSPANGLVIANEFFDALPIHLLQKQYNRWFELHVEESALGGFSLVPSPEVAPDLLAYAERYGADVPDRGLLEVNLEMDIWLTRIAAWLKQGRLLVIDYGYSQNELKRFPSGTLMSYYRHTALPDVLASPGKRDITALVNFTELRRLAAQYGLSLVRECPLATWALDQFAPRLEERWAEVDMHWRMQWKQLVFGLGQTFRVLEFERAVPSPD